MNGSNRSDHSNAFQYGFGKVKKIVIFDTILKQHLGITDEAKKKQKKRRITRKPRPRKQRRERKLKMEMMTTRKSTILILKKKLWLQVMRRR